MTAIRTTTFSRESLRNRAARRRGLTMAEVVVSTLLVGLLLVSSLQTVGGVVRTWQAASKQHDGFTLAAELMTEVLQARYFEPDLVEGSGGGGLIGGLLGLLGSGSGSEVPFGPDSGESGGDREDWDDTDDYDDWAASPPEAKDGTELTPFTGWTRTVNVQKVSVGNPNLVLNDDDDEQGVRRITVTVTAPDGRQTVLVAIRSYCGAMEQPPENDGTFVVWVGSELQLGAGSTAIRSATNVSNHAEDE